MLLSACSRHLLLLPLLLFLVAGLSWPAHASPADVQTTWRLLDYIAVDYAEAIADGQVVNQFEYDEMLEFSESVQARIAALPPSAGRTALEEQAAALKAAVVARRPPPEVAQLARGLGQALLAAHPVPLAPTQAPDMSRAAALYAQQCASCHGAKGEGGSGAFAQLDPPPIAFQDRERADQRSIFGLYQVITQGLEGTAMGSFAALPEADRWALAFYSGQLAYPNVEEGRRIWETDATVRALIPDMAALTAITPAALGEQIGEERAAAVIAYLRSNPGTVSASAGDGGLALVREKLAASLAAYQRGDRQAAEELALSAYLDGFEPLEAVLATRDGGLMTRIETALSGFRAAISAGRPEADLRARLAEISPLLDEADAALTPEAASQLSSFLGAFTILLREGLEALLVVIAMLAFLRKAERPDMIRWVHGGWVAALAAGLVTWLVATRLIAISGASREITEGIGALLAAAVLLSVGLWMHGKAQGDAWRRYIEEKMGKALTRGSAWFLFGLAFVVVYREVFETILFYAALWRQDGEGAIIAGAASAMLVLAVIAWAMLRFSRKLPIATFFRYSAILIVILAVVLAGKGVGALQEAGVMPITLLPGVPRITLIGLFPTAEAVAAQGLTLLLVILGFAANRRAANQQATAAA